MLTNDPRAVRGMGLLIKQFAPHLYRFCRFLAGYKTVQCLINTWGTMPAQALTGRVAPDAARSDPGTVGARGAWPTRKSP